MALHAEARVEEIVGGSVGVFELIQRIALAHTPNPSQLWSFRSFRGFCDSGQTAGGQILGGKNEE